MEAHPFTTNVGDFLVVMLTGCLGSYIAEVAESEPLMLKVEEDGPYARLKNGDFVIIETDSATLQADRRNGTDRFLESEHRAGRKVVSGLKELGVTDGKLHEMLATA